MYILTSFLHRDSCQIFVRSEVQIFYLTCRFLYPIYPLICVAAAAVIDSIPDLFRDKYTIDESLLVKVNLLSSLLSSHCFLVNVPVVHQYEIKIISG